MGLTAGEPIKMMTSTGLAPVVVPGEEIPFVTSIGPETFCRISGLQGTQRILRGEDKGSTVQFGRCT